MKFSWSTLPSKDDIKHQQLQSSFKKNKYFQEIDLIFQTLQLKLVIFFWNSMRTYGHQKKFHKKEEKMNISFQKDKNLVHIQ